MQRGESIAYDVARSAMRLSGEREVHVVCLEKPREMPADEVEVTEGAEEGLILHNSRGPREIRGENGRLTGPAHRRVHIRFRCQTIASARSSTKAMWRRSQPTRLSSPSASPPIFRFSSPETALSRCAG